VVAAGFGFEGGVCDHAVPVAHSETATINPAAIRIFLPFALIPGGKRLLPASEPFAAPDHNSLDGRAPPRQRLLSPPADLLTATTMELCLGYPEVPAQSWFRHGVLDGRIDEGKTSALEFPQVSHRPRRLLRETALRWRLLLP
jgi:hypothetical protein